MSRIVLKSNDSLNYYPNNNPSDFTVKIPNLSNIGHNLKVALSEIIFPFGFKNVREGYNQVDFIFATDKYKFYNDDDDDEIISLNKFHIKPDFYNPTSLIDEINAKIDNEAIKLELEIINNQGSVAINKIKKFRNCKR